MKRLGPLLLLVLWMTTGCKMGPDYRRPTIPEPGSWRDGAAQATTIGDVEWWQFFDDPVLTNLIAVALTNNVDVRIAAARVEEALAGYRAQRSYLMPSVDASAGWTRARSGITDLTGNQFNVFGLLSYEVDLWGRLRRLSEAARAQLLGTEYGSRSVQIGLVAAVASSYFNLRALDEQLAIAERTYASRQASLELTETKFDDGNGIVSELDVRQAETQVHSARATIATLERAIGIAENHISVLVGRNPGPVARESDHGVSDPVPGPVPAGLPSELLLRRPDILEAEQRLVAANANIGAARSAYFPTISLTAALGLESLELDDLFDPGLSRAWSFAPKIVGPIFNAGRVRAGIQRANALQEEALAAYEYAIQNAFREVEDGLISVRTLQDQLEAERANVVAERARLELSNTRYDAGVASYFEVLDAERSLFSAELSRAQTQADLRSAYAQLYKALGGGWESAPDR